MNNHENVRNKRDAAETQLPGKMLTLEQCQRLLPKGFALPKAAMELLREQLYRLAAPIVAGYVEQQKTRQQAQHTPTHTGTPQAGAAAGEPKKTQLKFKQLQWPLWVGDHDDVVKKHGVVNEPYGESPSANSQDGNVP